MWHSKLYGYLLFKKLMNLLCFFLKKKKKAPELISKEHYNGFAADCWALGVVLYVMLVGKFPFKG